ncbi:hypothetical protein M3Y97_00076500 [Aphelenchoides bicaudatus]|nr:hypothetical protein M3Y97_00076500 [Aphelenchoides bicaudatus]
MATTNLNLNGADPVDLESNVNRTYDSRQTPNEMKQMRKKGLPWIIAAFALILLILLAVLFVFAMNGFGRDTNCISAEKLSRADAKYIPASNTMLGRFTRAAVVSDNGICSEIGRGILFRGNAVDAAIAVAMCIGALHQHSSGLGGGFLATYYEKQRGQCVTLDARETAPLSTHLNTFDKDPKEAFVGYRSIATPGELHGYWTAFKNYGSGNVAWQDLVMPTVRLLNDGYPVTGLMEKNLKIREQEILNEPTMRKFFVNNATGKLYKEGEILKNPVLGETYRRLAVSSDPVRLFYFGEMAQVIAFEISTNNNGYVTRKDLESYRTIVDKQPLQNDHFHKDLVMCGPKPSSSFAVTQLILSVMSQFYPAGSDPEILFKDPLFYHRFVEAQKFAYAQRTRLGTAQFLDIFLADPKFVKEAEELAINMTTKRFTDEIMSQIKERVRDIMDYGADTGQPDDHGTSHVSVVDSEGNSVALTSSVNNIFGALVRSERLGIVFNDQMDDFSLPNQVNYFGFEPSRVNYIEPGKRPLSSMSPLIVYDKKTREVKASIGAAGGSKICSAVAQTLLHALSFNRTIKEATDFPRIHNQFTPITTSFEKDFPQGVLEELHKLGHNITEMQSPFSTVQSIFRIDGYLEASNDYRRPVYTYPLGF